VMILGQDFHSESGYRRSLAAGSESLSSPTWRNLLPVLKGAGIAPEQCFFTNAYMGLRAGNRATGRFPGARDPDFVVRCRRFLGVQIQVQRPRLIVTLGVHAPAMLAPLSAQLAPWRGAANLAAIDAAQAAIVVGARFDGTRDSAAVVVALTHPSQRRLNSGRRRYRGAERDAAEALMLEEAVRAAGVGS
jgi:uracil-DNA glycosylase